MTSARPSIVVVEDDAAVLNALTFAFEMEGYTVASFESGEAALDSPSTTAADCFVVDEKLPGASGLVLVSVLRSRGIAAPAILITTHPSEETRRRAEEIGVEIVEKPLLDDKLATRVHAALRAKSSG